MADDEKSTPEVLMELRDNMAPFFEQAEGIRAQMQEAGWSPTAAEQVALRWLDGAVQMMWAGIIKAAS